MALTRTFMEWMGAPQYITVAPTFQSSAIDASGEKFAWIGPVIWNDPTASKSIRAVGFLAGTIANAGGTVRVSLQNVDETTMSPSRPDGTQDQTVDFLVSALTTDTWYQTGALSADRSVTYGEMLAVVIEFQSFVAGDIVNVRNPIASSSVATHLSGLSHYSGAPAWAQVTNALPNIILEFSDGTFGTLLGGFPCSAMSSENLNSTTPGGDEIALKFRVPTERSVIGGYMAVASGGTSRDFDFVLYEGTTARKTLNVISETTMVTAGTFKSFVFSSEQDVSTGVDWYLALKPASASNNTIYTFTVANANHMQAHVGGTDWVYATRVDAGGWTPTTTKRPLAGLLVSRLHDGAGGGGQRVIGG
jgi:hypothetical protein